jgi:glycosyltransferase involved in cell wall biosynthesis
MGMVDFSIAICTWNRAGMLRRTLRAMESLRVPGHARWELLVVNNACTDDTDEVVHQFSARLPVRSIYEGRPGKSAALNRALATYQGEKLIWTDDDVIVDADWATLLLDAFEQFQADIVFGRSYPVWPDREPRWYGPALMGQFAVLDYGPGARVVSTPDLPYYGLNVGFTRAAIERLGPYREDLGYVGGKGGAGEDSEMFTRALAAGLRIVYEPRAVVGHCIPPERATKRRQRQLAWQGARTAYLLVREQAGRAPCWLGVPRYMYRLAIDDAWAMVKAGVQRDRSERFHREIRLWRFAGLLRAASRHLAASAGG